MFFNQCLCLLFSPFVTHLLIFLTFHSTLFACPVTYSPLDECIPLGSSQGTPSIYVNSTLSFLVFLCRYVSCPSIHLLRLVWFQGLRPFIFTPHHGSTYWYTKERSFRVVGSISYLFLIKPNCILTLNRHPQ